MEITFDPAKRAMTLQERGLDFADAGEPRKWLRHFAVFAGRFSTRRDVRFDYGEVRLLTAGFLRGLFVIVVWTRRGNARHIISMRQGHAKERRRWPI